MEKQKKQKKEKEPLRPPQIVFVTPEEMAKLKASVKYPFDYKFMKWYHLELDPLIGYLILFFLIPCILLAIIIVSGSEWVSIGISICYGAFLLYLYFREVYLASVYIDDFDYPDLEKKKRRK